MSAITNDYTMQSAMANVAESNLNNQKRTLERLGNSKSAEQVENEKLKEACQGFESIFIQKMWEQMRASLPKDGLMSSSKDEKFWQGMYDQELSKSMTNAGGIGLTDMMMEQMSKNKADTASMSKDSSPRTQGLNVPPAQILPDVDKAVEAYTQKAELASALKNAPKNAEARSPILDNSMYEEMPSEQAATVNSQVSASQNNDAQAKVLAEPIVQTITYQTNLPKNKRKGDKVVQNLIVEQQAKIKAAALADEVAKKAQSEASATSGQVNTQQSPLHRVEREGLPTMEFEELTNNNTVNNNTQILNANMQNLQGQQTLLSMQAGPTVNNTAKLAPNFENDILAGIRQSYVKTNTYADDRFVASKSQTQIDLQPTLAGGPDLVKPHTIEGTTELGYSAQGKADFAMPVEGKMSSGFGWRLDPLNGKRSWHNGIDIAADYGTKVKAADSGIVSYAGFDEELGNMLIVEHANGLTSVYGHNSELIVKAGDFVEKGTDIARIGSTGRTVGNHLHFEIRKEDMPINPETILNNRIMDLS